MCTEERHVRTWREGGHLHSNTGALGETNPAGTLIMDFLLLEL